MQFRDSAPELTIRVLSETNCCAAVECKFEILGEALHRAEQSDPELADQLPELRRIVGMRNRIIHGYDVVDEEILWDAVEFKVPILTKQISAILGEATEDL